MSAQWGSNEDNDKGYADLRRVLRREADGHVIEVTGSLPPEHADPLRVPGYAPPAAPGLPDPLTLRRIELAADWQQQEAARLAREADLAAEREPTTPRHARGHVFLAAMARGLGTVLIALGGLVVAAGTTVRGIGVRHLP